MNEINKNEISTEEVRSQAQPIKWVVDNFLPEGHKGMVTSPEGSFKTTLLAGLAIHVASDTPFLGMSVKQGSVLMIDEETPTNSLESKLDRFAAYLGYQNGYRQLPITVMSFSGFRFGRKTERDRILKIIQREQPKLITIDSVIACLPSGRQGNSENDSGTGVIIRDDLNLMLAASPGSSTMTAAHSGKIVTFWELEDYRAAEMQTMVRGSGSIVGEGCDTGFVIKKITETLVPIFVLMSKPRREMIEFREAYIALLEPANSLLLQDILPIPTPPSDAAIDLYSLFKNTSPGTEKNMEEIRKKVSGLYTPTDTRLGIKQLMRKRIIRTTKDHFTFTVNIGEGVDQDYLQLLERHQ